MKTLHSQLTDTTVSISIASDMDPKFPLLLRDLNVPMTLANPYCTTHIHLPLSYRLHLTM